MQNSSESWRWLENASRRWLEARFPDFRASDPIEGTYGCVYVMEARASSISPRKFAAKSLNPTKLERWKLKTDLDALFEREMKLWIKLPTHCNVVSATSIQKMPIPRDHQRFTHFDFLPFVTMPYCEGTLRDWIEHPPTPGDGTAPFIAIAHFCNGLCWIYDHGFHGHGDLKPENIFIDDLTEKAHLPDDFNAYPNRSHPCCVRVADFGWTDIWRDLGGTQRAWRPYLARERLEDTFVPVASDVFSIGVIAIELLTGLHPAGVPVSTVNSWKKSKYKAWANDPYESFSAIGSQIKPTAIRDLLQRCIAPAPDDRPHPAEVRDCFASVVKGDYGLDVGGWLASCNADADQKQALPGHDAWADRQIAQLGGKARDESIQRVVQRWNAECELRLCSDPEAAEWLKNAESLVNLLRDRNTPDDREHAADVAARVGTAVLNELWCRDPRKDILGTGSPELYTQDELPEFLLGYATWALKIIASIAGTEDSRFAEIKKVADEKFESFMRASLQKGKRRELEEVKRLLRELNDTDSVDE